MSVNFEFRNLKIPEIEIFPYFVIIQKGYTLNFSNKLLQSLSLKQKNG